MRPRCARLGPWRMTWLLFPWVPKTSISPDNFLGPGRARMEVLCGLDWVGTGGLWLV